MTVEQVVVILLTSILVNNVVTYFGFGNVAMGDSIKSFRFTYISCIIFTVGLLFSAFANYAINQYFFVKFNMTDFSVLGHLAIAVSCVFFGGLIVYKKSPNTFFLLKDNTYIITFTAMIVGASIFVCAEANGWLELLLYWVGMSIGYTLITCILHSFSGYSRRNPYGFTMYIFNMLTIAIISIIAMNFMALL